MLAEFVDRLSALAQEAQKPTIHTHPSLPEQVLVAYRGQLEPHDVPPPRRNHLLHAFPDFVRAVLRWGDEAVVMHDEAEIVAVLRDEGESRGRDVVRLPLEATGRWKTVEAMMEQPLSLPPAEAVRSLRFNLNGTGIDALVASLRKIDFSRLSGTSSRAEHGRESLGRSVEMAVQQAESIPEEFVAEVPMFSTPGLRQIVARVRMGLHLNLTAERIEIRPLADEVERWRDEAQMSIGSALTEAFDDKCQVFYGTP